MSKDTRGPAFPVPANEPIHPGTTGMMLRDYFAAKAMQGMMPLHWHREYAVVAEMAFAMADAMIEEGNK